LAAAAASQGVEIIAKIYIEIMRKGKREATRYPQYVLSSTLFTPIIAGNIPPRLLFAYLLSDYVMVHHLFWFCGGRERGERKKERKRGNKTFFVIFAMNSLSFVFAASL
jgi:hypothetical protein